MIAEQKEACKRSRTYWWGQLLRRLPCKTHYPGSVSCKEILLSGNVNHNKGTQEGPRKVSKRYDMMAAISTNIWFYVWDIVGQKKGPQHVYSYSHVTRFVYRSVEKLENIMRRTWVASILLHHKLDVQQTTVFFFFFLQRSPYREPALSWSWAQLRKIGENSRSIVEFGHHVRRFNMKRGNVPKPSSAALDIVPDTLFVREFRKGVVNSKNGWPALTLFVWQRLEELGDVPMFWWIWSTWSLCVR